MIRLNLLFLLGVLSLPRMTASAAGQAFTVREEPDRLVITRDGRPVATYVFRDPKILRPYFCNVHAPGGIQVTRHHPPLPGKDATDHDAMHPGLWLAFGDINGQDFWRNKGRIEHTRLAEPPKAEEERLTFATESRLLGADGAALGALSSHFRLIGLTNAWLLVWDATFRPADGELIFGDQEEMGLGARVATAITEKNGGIIISSRGAKTAQNTWGQPAEWCDYSGTVEGQPAGITLMAAPSNFRPCWWHNRDYGLMVANPFGREAMKQGGLSRVVVRKGECLRLRFGVSLHSGAGDAQARIATAYQEFGTLPAGGAADGP